MALIDARARLAIARPLLMLAATLAALLPTSPATAQTGGTTGSGALEESDFSIYVQLATESGQWSALDTSETKTVFDQARCLCGSTVRFVVEAASSTASSKLSTLLASSGADGEGRLYLGQTNACTLDPTDTSYGCKLIDQVDELSSLVSNGYWISAEVSVGDLFAWSGTACSSAVTQYLWLWLDTASDGSADLTGASAPSLGLRLDGKAPSPPTALTAQPGKGALVLGWTASTSASAASTDLAGYLAFCARADGTTAFISSPYDGQFVSPATLVAAGLCPNQDTLDASTLADTFANGGAAFLCSGLIGSDQTSYRLKGLENDVPYGVAMVAVDNDGNLGKPTDVVTATPMLTVDFYSEYVNEGGEPVGGYCAVARGRTSAATFALVGLMLIGLLARRRGRQALLPIVLLSCLAPQAAAQAIFHDDDLSAMERLDDRESTGLQSPRSMSVELRLGPFRPGVDAALHNGATPYATTFGGGTHVLYQLEVDYEVLQSFGTLAVGLGAGYFRAIAKAFVGTSDGTATAVRSSDDTALRLIPLSLLAVYRMDVMAERWKVPLVPYAKLGLGYTLWQVTDGNGDVAVTPQGARGAGGSAGWQAAAGLALPLDLLDHASMRELDGETGLNHMYLCAEWSYVDASGLGMGSRLHVGDSTWSAGLMLEF